MSETTPLIKAALNLRVGVGFDVYSVIEIIVTLSDVYKCIFSHKKTDLLSLDFRSNDRRSVQDKAIFQSISKIIHFEQFTSCFYSVLFLFSFVFFL